MPPERRSPRVSFVTGELQIAYSRGWAAFDAMRASGVEAEVVGPSHVDTLRGVADVDRRELPLPKGPAAVRQALALPLLVSHWAASPPDLVHVLDEGLREAAVAAARAAGVPWVVAELPEGVSSSAAGGADRWTRRLPAPVRGRVEAFAARRPAPDRWVVHDDAGFRAATTAGWDAEAVRLLDGGWGADVEAWSEPGDGDARRIARQALGIPATSGPVIARIRADDAVAAGHERDPIGAVAREREGRVLALDMRSGAADDPELRPGRFEGIRQRLVAADIAVVAGGTPRVTSIGFMCSLLRVPVVTVGGAPYRFASASSTGVSDAAEAVRALARDEGRRVGSAASAHRQVAQDFGRETAAQRIFAIWDELLRSRLGEPLTLDREGRLGTDHLSRRRRELLR